MAEKDIKAALRKQKNCPECLEAIGRIAKLEGEVDRMFRINAELEAVLQAVRRLLMEYTEGDPPSHPSVRDPLFRAIYSIDAALKEDG